MRNTIFQLVTSILLLVAVLLTPAVAAKVTVIPLNKKPKLSPYAEVADINSPNSSFILTTHVATDMTTGLAWQKAVDTIARTWSEAWDYCQDLNRGGFTDWRLPNVNELVSIVDYSAQNPAINIEVFPTTQSAPYWAAETHPYGTTDAWCVYFTTGRVDSYSKPMPGTFYVRCVRSSPQHQGNFRNNGNGTVIDLATGLTWQQIYESNRKTWVESDTYCENLNLGGANNWRLPNIKELQSLVETRVDIPTIDSAVFPDVSVNYSFWTSTPDQGDSNEAWATSFNAGKVHTYDKGSLFNTRCVRW